MRCISKSKLFATDYTSGTEGLCCLNSLVYFTRGCVLHYSSLDNSRTQVSRCLIMPRGYFSDSQAGLIDNTCLPTKRYWPKLTYCIQQDNAINQDYPRELGSPLIPLSFIALNAPTPVAEKGVTLHFFALLN